MKNIKKLKSYGKAIAGSALLVGATLTGAAGLASAQSGSSGDATLADYPHPFVDDEGNLDSTVVVGTDGKQADVVSAIDIAGNLGNNAFSSETVESSAGAVDGEQEEDTIRDTIDISIDASDYSAFTRETVEDEDGDDVFVTESADFSGSSNVNGTDAEIAFDEGDISYSIKYSPGFSQGDDITLLGEEYELVEIVDTGEVKLGSTLEQSLTVGEDYTHGPYTVEVTGRSSGDNPEAVVRVSSEEEILETRALETDEAIELENDQEVDDTEFTVNATSVIFYEDGTSEVSLESTVQDTTLEEGEDLPMDDRYEVNTLGVNSEENRLSEIKTSNTVQTVDEPEDDEEDETAHLETGDSFTGPSDYFTVTNQGLSNEATGEIEIEEDYEVTYEDSNNFEHSLDITNVKGSSGAGLNAFGSDIYHHSAETSTGYTDGDAVLQLSAVTNTISDDTAISNFNADVRYTDSSSHDGSYTNGEAIIEDTGTQGTFESGDTVRTSGDADMILAEDTDIQYYSDPDGSSGFQNSEYIYDLGGDSNAVESADDTRLQPVTVTSKSKDSTTGEIELALSNPAQVNTGDKDSGKTLSTGSAQLVIYDWGNTNTAPNWEAGSDEVYLDVDGDGIDAGDLVLIQNGQGTSLTQGEKLTSDQADSVTSETDQNDVHSNVGFDLNFDDSSSSGNAGTYESGDQVYIDVGTNDATSSSIPDIQITGSLSTVTTSTPTTYNTKSVAVFGRWDSDRSSGKTVQDGIYADMDNDGAVSNLDVRASTWTAELPQGSVSSEDVDIGTALNAFTDSDDIAIIDAGNTGNYDPGTSGSSSERDAILASADTTLEDTDTVVKAGQADLNTFQDNIEMYQGSGSYSDGDTIVSVDDVIISGDSGGVSDGGEVSNFASDLKHTDSSGDYDGDAIIRDENNNNVFDSGIDTVVTGSAPTTGTPLVTTSDSDTEFYTDINGYPLEIEYDSGSEEATFTYEEFEETVSSGESESFTTGYGFSFTADFTQDSDTELVISGSDTVLSTEEDAKISFSSDEVTVTEENSETITVEYDGSDQLDRISFSGDPSDLTDTDDGDSTLTGFGSAVELDSDSSATVTYPDEPLEQLSAFGSIGEGTGEGSVMSPTGWASGSAATDEEASTDQNLVLVGGPLVNDLTGDLADQGSTWNSSEYESNQGVGVLDLVNDAFDGNTALVVAGWQADDTSAAAEYLVENAGAQELEGRSTVQVDTESGELLQ